MKLDEIALNEDMMLDLGFGYKDIPFNIGYKYDGRWEKLKQFYNVGNFIIENESDLSKYPRNYSDYVWDYSPTYFYIKQDSQEIAKVFVQVYKDERGNTFTGERTDMIKNTIIFLSIYDYVLETLKQFPANEIENLPQEQKDKFNAYTNIKNSIEKYMLDNKENLVVDDSLLEAIDPTHILDATEINYHVQKLCILSVQRHKEKERQEQLRKEEEEKLSLGKTGYDGIVHKKHLSSLEIPSETEYEIYKLGDFTVVKHEHYVKVEKNNTTIANYSTKLIERKVYIPENNYTDFSGWVSDGYHRESGYPYVYPALNNIVMYSYVCDELQKIPNTSYAQQTQEQKLKFDTLYNLKSELEKIIHSKDVFEYAPLTELVEKLDAYNYLNAIEIREYLDQECLNIQERFQQQALMKEQERLREQAKLEKRSEEKEANRKKRQEKREAIEKRVTAIIKKPIDKCAGLARLVCGGTKKVISSISGKISDKVREISKKYAQKKKLDYYSNIQRANDKKDHDK